LTRLSCLYSWLGSPCLYLGSALPTSISAWLSLSISALYTSAHASHQINDNHHRPSNKPKHQPSPIIPNSQSTNRPSPTIPNSQPSRPTDRPTEASIPISSPHRPNT
jgi:hypothetical protein